MKTPFRLLPLLLVAALFTFTSCNNYGKRVAVDGTKGEVYYKGNGVNEAEAKKTGDYLKEIGFFTDTKAATVQITKQENAYTVRFVYDKTFYDQTPTAETSFKKIGYEMSQKIFNGSKVNIALADSMLSDFKTIPYDASAVAQFTTPVTNTSGTSSSSDLGSGNTATSGTNSSSDLGPDNTTSSLGPVGNTLQGYDHDILSDINFYWKDVSTADVKVISDYIIRNGSFAGGNGNVNIIVNKEGDRYIVRFPVAGAYVNDVGTMAELEKVAQQIKDNVFARQAYSFIVTDTQLNNLKSWDY